MSINPFEIAILIIQGLLALVIGMVAWFAKRTMADIGRLFARVDSLVTAESCNRRHDRLDKLVEDRIREDVADLQKRLAVVETRIRERGEPS